MSFQMKDLSILRHYQYEALSKLSLEGDVLDLGGSTLVGYHKLLVGTPRITTANINSDYGCELVFDAEQPFPIADALYDAAISLNVFEHLYRPQHALSELARVVKPGGTLFLTVPFMFHVHASPDDFFRYTGSALTRMLQDAGFDHVVVTPVSPGFFSLVYQTLDAPLARLPRAVKHLLKPVTLSIDRMLSRAPWYRRAATHIPLGYIATARRSR